MELDGRRPRRMCARRSAATAWDPVRAPVCGDRMGSISDRVGSVCGDRMGRFCGHCIGSLSDDCVGRLICYIKTRSTCGNPFMLTNKCHNRHYCRL
jgi:hypothetical protein